MVTPTLTGPTGSVSASPSASGFTSEGSTGLFTLFSETVSSFGSSCPSSASPVSAPFSPTVSSGFSSSCKPASASDCAPSCEPALFSPSLMAGFSYCSSSLPALIVSCGSDSFPCSASSCGSAASVNSVGSIPPDTVSSATVLCSCAA